MSTKQIEVTCPCCSTVLTVDVSTAKILRTSRANERGDSQVPVERWETASKRVRQRVETGADKLESALADERDKEARLAELFKKAQEKHAREKNES